jgi:uncharacterized LabA/DUF88 family protein
MDKKRVYAYVDASNFYHLSKLNYGISKVYYHHLVNFLLKSEIEELIRIKYFVAPVNRQECPEMYAHQQKFFHMLKKTPLLDLKLGKLVSRPLNNINILCPNCGLQRAEELQCPNCENRVKLSETSKTTEKGVDVSLAITLLLDALSNKYDVALLLSSDADFCPAIRYILKELGKEVIYCRFPSPKTFELIQCCSDCRIIKKEFIENSKIGS